eukprot:NODE_14_length_51535_cov_1.125049.p44 type:complete len:119 gc:universal NODE_14_length_51535_cov_1.125049:17797-18153(+)
MNYKTYSHISIKKIHSLKYDIIGKCFSDNLTEFKSLRIFAFVVSCVEKKKYFMLELEDGTGILSGMLWIDRVDTIPLQFNSYMFTGNLEYYDKRQLQITDIIKIKTDQVWEQTYRLLQ